MRRQAEPRTQARECIERHDSTKRGKGYAIQYLIDSLILNEGVRPPGRIGFRRCRLDGSTLTYSVGFARILDSGHDWIQCYDAVGNADQSWRTRLMAYAFSLINGVTLQGQSATGIERGPSWQRYVYLDRWDCGAFHGTHRPGRGPRILVVGSDRRGSDRVRTGRVGPCDDAHSRGRSLHQPAQAVGIRPRQVEANHARPVITLASSRLDRKNCGPYRTDDARRWSPSLSPICSCSSARFFVSLHLAATQEYFLFYSIAFCLTIASLALGVQAICPFLLGLLPWRFASSLIYLPYFAIWKTLVSLQGHPKVGSARLANAPERDDSPGHHAGLRCTIRDVETTSPRRDARASALCSRAG